MRTIFIVCLFAVSMAAQDPDPVLVEWKSALAVAQQDSDMGAIIGRLIGTDDRVVLCTLSGSVTRLRCFHSTQRMIDGVVHVAHTEPTDYDGQPIADILAAERAWVGL